MIMAVNEAWKRNVSDADKGQKRRSRCHVVWQTVPNGRSGDWEGLAANGRQFHGRHRQKVAVMGRDCRHSLFFLDSQESLTLVSAAHTLLLN